jgi:hypothetical protein
VGCGAGNTFFPLLSVNKNPEFYMYACDFSETAVEIVKVCSYIDIQQAMFIDYFLLLVDQPKV